MHLNHVLVGGLCLALGSQPAPADSQKAQEPKGTNAVESSAKPASAPARKSAPGKPVVTLHSIKLEGETLHYTATAGYLPLKDKMGKVEAQVFYVAYTRESAPELTASRPLGFAFNGGPGASSVWLHLGGIGPKRLPLAADGTALPPTVKLVDNESTWLGFTDLVFMDPVGTGFSYATKGTKTNGFYALHKDIEVAGEFIRLYVTENERWLSPKFVIGESYGTTRAAGLARHLQKVQGLDLAGVVLLSSALNFEAFTSGQGSDLAYVLAMPSFTAVATYHKKLPPQSPAELDRTLAGVEHWALDDYTTLLAKGDTLTDAERERLATDLAQRTGLPTNYLAMSRWRVGAVHFTKELLRSQGLTVGLLDGRVTGVDTSRLGQYPQYDPAMFISTGPFQAAINDYLRRVLKFKTSRPYELFSPEVNRVWKWETGGPVALYIGDELANAMSRDTRLRVFGGAGHYDLTTPYLSQKYVYDHLGLEPMVRSNLAFHLYPSGHMIYTDTASLKKLRADAAAFVKEASGPE